MYAAFQGAYLALDGRAAIDGQHAQAVNVFGIVVQVARYLEAKLARRAEDEGLGDLFFYVDFLYQRQSEGGSLPCSGLCQCYYVVVFS